MYDEDQKDINKSNSIEKDIEDIKIRINKLEKNIKNTDRISEKIDPKKYELELDNKSKYQIGALAAFIITLLIIYWLFRIF
tara:strand:+ start:307 stop:549 length:243 start_codon:yes stop_codon:yes gene_type:complete